MRCSVALPVPLSFFRIGCYAVFDRIASGGMANVHLGRRLGPPEPQSVVAVKRLRPEFAAESDFIAMLMDEAALTRRIVHPSIVPVLDLVHTPTEVCLVTAFVYGETLRALQNALDARNKRVPLTIASAICCDVLAALHAAHEARDTDGSPLHMVHRDVSPHNIMVGVDGRARVIDFGIAKAVSRLQSTIEGQVKGKVAYMAPEQLTGLVADRRCDLFSTGIVLWEILAGARLFTGADSLEVGKSVVCALVPPIGSVRHDVPPALAEVVHRALKQQREARFASAAEMRDALQAAMPPAGRKSVARWLLGLAAEAIRRRRRRALEIEGYDLSTSGQPGQEPGDEPTLVDEMPPFFEVPDDDEPTVPAAGGTPHPPKA